MAKKIAVLVRDRQGEALRMSIGITVMDDIIDVFILDKKIVENEENSMNLEMIKDMGMNLCTNIQGYDDIQYVATEEIGRKLLEYDNILAY
ncbi:MAG: hypothetical protein SFH39_14625 [Candidatus Magnetobacterium sp. LHC-1]|uniref:Uncharacterized protein n=1 Tax=Candidatus Magnetobacterium casense TaxID=1455061 RepID=A0ABS6RVE1_9BACT|nr:hypothetical protein [Candidatus Magnetobacterium casensis]MBF0607476.1 hypothetical protein [Nitrospirota bacterium]MBV6340596.1 hypothetical protein [Candidatus Magnetobacterium casensis]